MISFRAFSDELESIATAQNGSRIKMAADLRNLTPEQKEELKQFAKNTGAIVAGTGVGLAGAGLTRVALEKMFGPQGRWPNKLHPTVRRIAPVAVPVLGGGSLYLYHQMRKKKEDLLEEAGRRGRRKASSS